MGITIPTIDLSPFFKENDEVAKKKAMQIINQACSEYGFFQIVNHGVPLGLMRRAIDLSRKFFERSPEEKLKCAPNTDAPLPAGYARQPDHSRDKNEYVLMFPPQTGLNVYPSDPPQIREVAEEIFSLLTQTGLLIENIINECLGLPPNFLKDFNNDRSWDFMTALHYFPGTETENNGILAHEDSNIMTFVFQNTGGLEVCKNGEWIPIIPVEGTIVVNISDVIQVLTNKKFKSATHRVIRPLGKHRYSYAFFYNIAGDKWIEPLPEFTKEKGEAPKYKGFLYKDYLDMRIRNKTHPPPNPEDAIHITYYEIPT